MKSMTAREAHWQVIPLGPGVAETYNEWADMQRMNTLIMQFHSIGIIRMGMSEKHE